MAVQAVGALAKSVIGGITGAARQKGGGSPKSAPSVSPGIDPGRYAFELLFNRRRRDEEQANLDREFAEEQRQFDVVSGQRDRQQDMSGVGMLAEQRQMADKNARLRSFRKALLNG